MSVSTGRPELNRQSYTLPAHLASSVKVSLEDWRANNKVQRLWERDASLWTGTDEASWLGWLGIVQEQSKEGERLISLAEEIKQGGFSHLLLLGMGGSSLCPEVLKVTFGRMPGYPELHVLDSTDPAQIKTFESKVDLARTLCIVASKSGSTLEPNIFKQHFYERIKEVVGASQVGSHFIAITDPGSKMQQVAESDHFRNIFFGVPSIGGRYSALSSFGLVPAALMGLDVRKFLYLTAEMVKACSAETPIDQNPGLLLGTVLGVLAREGRDKVTLVASPDISDLGAWLEQLLAESTGKIGKGLIPVDRERLGRPELYGHDRLFVYVRFEATPDASQDAAVDALERAGHPVVRISMTDPYTVGQEFFRWEIATAVAGAIMEINPFNQPDVEASKIATRKLTTEYERTGALPPEAPIFETEGIQLFTDQRNAKALDQTVGGSASLISYLRAHLRRLTPGDYFAILAYIEMNQVHEDRLQAIRHAVRDARSVATCLGFGPRFLHSTGQAYKGGPNTGVFMQITCNDSIDLPVPGQRYTFGVVKAAQARGDFEVLAERQRRALRVHLARDPTSGLAILGEAIRQALS